MGTFQVRLFPDGEYQKIEAATAKEAAEKLYGRQLSEVGGNRQVRVMVHKMVWPRSPNAILFYERA
jgi:hypothetical protein